MSEKPEKEFDPETVTLSPEDYAEFCRCMTEHREPTPIMKAAYERYKRLVTSKD